MPITEPCDARMRDELLNETLFFDLDQARNAIARWVAHYNHQRPNSALGYATPAAFAAGLTATAARLHTLTSSADRPLLRRRSDATMTPGSGSSWMNVGGHSSSTDPAF